MASYITYVGETQVLLEAPVGGAFAKSSSESRPDPDKAINNMIENIRILVTYIGKEIGPALRESGAAFELGFGVRADNVGTVMISENANVGQFQCVVKWPAMRPVAAPPPRPQPALTDHRRG